MTNNTKDTLAQIKQLMQESTRFLSLSGLSGISAGVIALIGYILYSNMDFHPVSILLPVLILASFAAIFFSYRKAKLQTVSFWNPVSRRFLFYFSVPMITGGVFCSLLYFGGFTSLIIPSMLIFYGFSLFSSSKYTFSEIEFLGFVEILLGLAAMLHTEYQLMIWAAGFGVLHILYGAFMYYRYEK